MSVAVLQHTSQTQHGYVNNLGRPLFTEHVIIDHPSKTKLMMTTNNLYYNNLCDKMQGGFHDDNALPFFTMEEDYLINNRKYRKSLHMYDNIYILLDTRTRYYFYYMSNIMEYHVSNEHCINLFYLSAECMHTSYYTLPSNIETYLSTTYDFIMWGYRELQGYCKSITDYYAAAEHRKIMFPLTTIVPFNARDRRVGTGPSVYDTYGEHLVNYIDRHPMVYPK